MEIEKKNTTVTKEDLVFLDKELQKTLKPILLNELTKKLAYYKSAPQLSQEVKKYDPYCSYSTGDSIYKEYDEPLTVSSKGAEHFSGAVVLKVVNKVTYENFNCEMLEVDYSGGGVFRKYIDYMKKSKTQVLLPSNLEGKALVPEIMKKEEDPRLNELPMTDKALKTLAKNLKASLSKSPRFFSWNEYWQLAEKQIKIKDEKIKEIENHLSETKESEETSVLINKFFGLNPSNKLFQIHCLSLNSVLEKIHKKKFVYVSPVGWGKWHLKNILDSLIHGLPFSAPLAKIPKFEEEENPPKSRMQTESLKLYLSWREILSGGIKTPQVLNKELSSFREYIFSDEEGGGKYTLYFLPSHNIFLGLKDFYEQNNVPQGASLTLEKTGTNQFNFFLKKSKKKLSIFKVAYDPEEDKFRETGEELFTFSLPNKIIHLEKETFSRIFSLYSLRDDLDLRELLNLIFKNFGVETDNYSLHYLRAYHLVDLLKQTTLEDVELVLFNSPEFIESDKNKGIYFYQEKIEIEEEVKPEAPPEIPAEAPSERKEKEEVPLEEKIPSEVSPKVPEEEITPEIVELEKEEVILEAQKGEAEVRIQLEEPAEKVLKKRRLRMDREKGPRIRKGERRIIEEKIEIQELEQEALTAVKEKKEEAREEIPMKEKKAKFKKPVVAEEPVFGLFADKLKSALDTKQKKKKIKKK
jgi:hypothetical protein